MASACDYAVFGLRVRSELELPELVPVPNVGNADVHIRVGIVEGRSNEGGLHSEPSEAVLVIPGVARYRISGGCEIVVQPEVSVPERNVRLYLLGSAFGALLHQRGLLPLHANGVQIGESAIAVMGPSGAGKSTLASWFEDRGMAVVADDVCVIHFDEAGAPFTRSGIRRLRLWKDALEARGLQPSAFQPSYTGDPSFEKFDVPMTTHIASEVRLPLAAIYLLAKGQRTKVELLEGVEALDAIFAHTYRGGFVSQLRADTGHWAACVRLVDRTPVFRFVRRWGSADMNEQNSLLVAHATTLLETVSSSR